MKVKLDLTKNTCEVVKEQGDPRFTRGGWGDAESTFLYHVLKALKQQGHDVLKKRMWKDGHMVDNTQQYIRTRRYLVTPDNTDGQFCLYNSAYAVCDLGEEFNKLQTGESLDITVVR